MEISTKDEFMDVIIDLLPMNVLKRYIIVRDDYAGYTREFHKIVNELWSIFVKSMTLDRYTIYHRFGMYLMTFGSIWSYDYIYTGV